jgi:hypothetical protein
LDVPKYDNSPQVNETALGEEDDVATIWHGETVDLRLDVGDGNSIGLEPGDIDFNVEVTDADKSCWLARQQNKKKPKKN